VALTLLREPSAAIRHAMLMRVQAMRPGKAIVQAASHSQFAPLQHAQAGHASIEITDALCTEWAYTLGEEVATRERALRVGSLRVRWKAHVLEVFQLWFPTLYGSEQRCELVVADTLEVAERYFVEVCEYASEVRGEVLVFANGAWDKSVRLFESIQATRWDDLVLAGDLSQRLREDFDRFVAARTEYARWRVPWKRGALFIGPPGNGKTMAVRGLAKHLGLPCLYVQSFVAQGSTEQASMEAVFARARRAAPCLMVLEDLDSLVTPGARSFFLNELDGFAANEGLITIASTNHPDRLDPAIVDRPSRFDRKYHFDPPAELERRAYAATWNARLPEGLSLDETALDGVAATTADFSFAYLKELFAAALMRLMSGPVERSRFLDALRVETAALRAQMKTTNVVPIVPAVLVDPETAF
jgi:SpoVK/Ycf46/Vps4 family AAA+-type ATPase